MNGIPRPSSFKYDGKTYEFYGWTDTYTDDFIYTGRQSKKSPTSIKITNNSVEFYALYTTDDETQITYTVDPGKETSFDEDDFEKVYKSQYSGSLEYVEFDSISSSTYKNFSGSIYYGSSELSRSDLTSNKFYTQAKAGRNDYEIDELSLVAAKGADDDEITVSFTVEGTRGSVDGTLKLVVGDKKGDGEIVYKVAPGGTVDFDADDFNEAYQDLSGSSSDIKYVKFTATKSYTSFDGAISCGSKDFDRDDLNDAKFYYSSKSYGDYDLDKLSFTADKKADDGDSLSISFRAYRSSGDYEDGTLKIVIDDDASGSGDITYKVAAGKEVDFDEDDFNDYYQEDADTSNDIKWVEFSTTDTLSSSEGTIYYDYGYSDQKSFTKSTIDDYKFYYGRSSSSGDYALDDLSFVAGKNASDHTVELSFRAYYSNTRYADGTLVIQVGDGEDAGDVTIKVKPGKYTDLDKTDFQSYLRSKCGDKKATVDYVRFDRPSSSVFSDLTLYSNYGKSSQTSFSASSLNGYTFYYNSKDATGSKEYGLDTLTFAADTSFKESVKLTFTVYGDDDEEEEGTLVIQPDGAAAGTSNYVGSVRYNITSGNRVQINANDIARFFKRNAGTNMQYVTLTGVPSTGSLYYNYYNTSKYGTSSRAQLTASNCSGQNFYASPTSTSQFALTELTYVPSGKNYCATIPFTAYGGSRSVSGAILISVTSAAVSEVYGVVPKGTAITFPTSDISKAVSAATGTAPSSIQLLSLPSYTAGTVYVGSGTSTAADTSTAYAIFNGTQSLRFVPSSSYTGNVEIPYVALNSSGAALASGTFSLGVVKAKKSFSDVNSSTWCYKYVAELSDASVIAGYANGSFKPNNTVTYGAALKLIMLAAGYPEQAPTVKNSPFSGYLAKARADGIVTRSNVNLSATITRQQVAQLAAGAMKLDTSSLSTVQPFTDTTDTSVRALNAAGIVEGYFSNGTSTFKPNNTLTRGQISAIVWRMRNYTK
ncbi:S-layer homology domain-containing protein [uncultured Dysosmobacter sp.]|uniref:S-layer homology domain-containing protein n=1 Tax=uncultured Dysosmobacter sp. TaxID=2591384 RepID=UPI002638AD8B|nr:S-layer homology domain-containing protein [uncultured Dysosmobacter sp.]